MKQRKQSDRVLMIRVGGACDTTLEVRVGSQDPDDRNLPCSPEFTGVTRPGKRFFAQYGSVGVNFARHYVDQTRWDHDSISVGYFAKYGGDFFSANTAEYLTDTLKWMCKQVYAAMEKSGHPRTVDEAVVLLAQAWDTDCVFIRNHNGYWNRYTEPEYVRRAIQELQHKTLAAKVA